ncbi:hypothetical protein [Streptomyces caelestis]|uniref:hypothetical protein n=1 Tax=Streptomyces caelestis TaxID=36816 RepID=UPI0036618D97
MLASETGEFVPALADVAVPITRHAAAAATAERRPADIALIRCSSDLEDVKERLRIDPLERTVHST